MIDPFEEKAREAKSGDETAIRELADLGFSAFGGVIPKTVKDKLKDRAVRAEVEYKKNGKGGVREVHIARAVNYLADKFKAPDYAKTDARQVRVLRAMMKFDYPSIFAPDPDAKKGLRKKIGDLISPEVSPLEATFLLTTMLEQKMLNDNFQQTPEKFVANLKKKSARLEDHDGDRQARLVFGTPRNHEKRREMMRIMENGIANMSMDEALNLADDTLDKLGIKREEER